MDPSMVGGGRIVSVNVGHRRPRRRATARLTAIDKLPVDRVDVRDPGPKRGGLGSGVVGDEIGDQRHHGGRLQAVYAYAVEDLRWWAGELGRPMTPGLFGENLTTEGLDLTGAVIGVTWMVGGAVLRVEVPRIPCATFAEQIDEPRWVSRFTEAGRTGAYLSVVTPGTITAGDEVRLQRPDHDLDLLVLFRAFGGDLTALRRVVAAGVLDAEVQGDLEEEIARRGA